MATKKSKPASGSKKKATKKKASQVSPPVIHTSSKSGADLITDRFRSLLPDVEGITERIINADLDHTQAMEVTSKVDDLVEWAPNAISWCHDKLFLGMTPFAKQCEVLLHLFEEWCVTADTLIPTERGLIPIGELAPNKEPIRDFELTIATHAGPRKSARAGWMGKKEVFDVTMDNGLEMTATESQPFMTLGQDLEILWKPLRDLEVGDYVAVNGLDSGCFPSEDPTLPSEVPSKQWHGKTKVCGMPGEMTSSLAALLGYFVGDGHCGKWRRGLTDYWYTSSRREMVDDFVRCLEESFPGVYYTIERGENWWNVRVCGLVFATWMHEQFPGIHVKSHEKKIPSAVLRSSRESQRAFLGAYFSCGASLQRPRVFSSSKELLKQVQVMLSQWGAYTSLYLQKSVVQGETQGVVNGRPVIARHPSWCLDISSPIVSQNIGFGVRDEEPSRLRGRNGPAYMPEIAKREWCRLAALPGADSVDLFFDRSRKDPKKVLYSWVQEPDGVVAQIRQLDPKSADRISALAECPHSFVRIESIEYAGEQDTYDFTVPDVESFIGNGVVLHNCPRCSDNDYVQDIPVQDPIESVLSNVALLEFGSCPHCGFRKGVGRAEGIFKDPTELVAPVGQRSGKCLSGDTEFFDGTRRITVEDAVGTTFQVVTKRADNTIGYAAATAFESGEKECVELIGNSGAAVTLSTDHRVFTPNGWVEAGNLGPDDLIAMPRHVPEPPEPLQVDDDEVAMVAHLLSDGGIKGLAKDKRVPGHFWGLSDSQMALFLNRFWACDGYITDGGVGITLASEKMIDDLQFFLLRFGVQASKRYRVAKCQTGEYDAWRLECAGPDALHFLQKVGPVLGKEPACERLKSALLSRKQPKSLTDPVPVPVARPQIQEIADEIRWQRILSIKSAGKRKVYDLSVPETECFVASNMVLHNSAVTAMASSYLIHRNLHHQMPWKEYGLAPGQILDFTFVATTMQQSERTLWGQFKGLFTSSPWFKAYKEVSDLEGRKQGNLVTVKNLETYISFGHKRLLIYFAANDPAQLRGSTRFGAAIDELSWFGNKAGGKRSNGPETYAALNNSCLTIRNSVYQEIKKDPNSTWAMPMLFNVSSPVSMDDPLMALYRTSASNPRAVRKHWATWEAHPTNTKEYLTEIGEMAKPTSERDYGAQPPMAHNPLLRASTVTEAFKSPLALESRYGPIIRPYALGYVDQKEVSQGVRTASMLTAGLLPDDQVPLPDFDALRNVTEKDLDNLGNSKELFLELVARPPNTRMHIMGVDLGSTNNGLGVVCGYLAGGKFITDFALEIKPHSNLAINIAQVYESLIVPLVDRLNVVAVYYDTWNCVTGDTLVYTDQGVMEIKDMPPQHSEGVVDCVTTLATKVGTEKTSKWGKMPRREVTEVTLKGGYSIKGTDDHKLWSVRSDCTEAAQWKTIGQLEIGDWIGLKAPGLWPSENHSICYDEDRPAKIICPLCQREMTHLQRHIIFSHKMKWAEFKEQYPMKWTSAKTGKHYKLPGTVTPDLARLLGYLISEGTYGEEFYNSNREVVDDYVRCFESCFNTSPGVYYREHAPRQTLGASKVSDIQPGWAVSTNSVDISKFLEFLMGGRKKSAEKDIPKAILRSTKEVQVNFLRALYEGDGCASTKAQSVSYISVSETLLSQITCVLVNFGIWCTTPACMSGSQAVKYLSDIGFVTKKAVMDDARGCAKDYVPAGHVLRMFVKEHRAILAPSDNFLHALIYTMGDVTRSTCIEFNDRFGGEYPEYKAKIDDLLSLNWRRVKSKEAKGATEVYDVTVPGSHSFVANGIVSHNSLTQIQDLAVKFGSLGPLNDRVARRSWLRKLAKRRERPGFIADSYKLNLADAMMLSSRLEQGDCLFPAMEMGMMDLMVSQSIDPIAFPYTHLALQAATVRTSGNRLLKPLQRDDDIFRAWTNAAVPALTNELVIDLLHQEHRAQKTQGGGAQGFHVSLGQVGRGIRRVEDTGRGASSTSGTSDFPVVVRKGKFGS